MASVHRRKGLLSALLTLATSAALLGLFAAIAQAKPGPNFGSTCDFAFASNVDPIFEPVTGHAHLFFGAENVTNDSTGATIRGTTTSCDRVENSSSYWLPRVYSNGNPLPVDTQSKDLGDNTIYYQKGSVTNPDLITVFPADFEIVARDNATQGDVKWTCDTGGLHRIPLTEAPPATCPADGAGRHLLTVRIKFPQCWDNKQVNEPNIGPENLRLANAEGKCVFNGVRWTAVPQITMSLNFTLPSKDVGRIRVAGDSGLQAYDTMHADFMNGWEMTELKRLTVGCIKGYTTDANKPAYCADPLRK